jgi:hypothetical protein
MISTDPKTLEKMKALAERNIANGDWGDEVTIFGLPGETMPISPEERIIKMAGNKKLPPKK